MISYICGVHLTVGVWLTVGFPSRSPGVGGAETISADIANVTTPLRGLGGRWAALIFI